jgi:hypothetical protein
MRERWPELRFEMKAGYLQMRGSHKERGSWAAMGCAFLTVGWLSSALILAP